MPGTLIDKSKNGTIKYITDDHGVRGEATLNWCRVVLNRDLHPALNDVHIWEIGESL